MKKFLFSALLLLSSPAFAYYDVLDNAEVLPKGSYKLTGDLQALTDTGGANLGAIFDMGFQEEFGARILGGFGHTDYFVGGMFKWIPIPDVEGQPAVGMNLGIVYGRYHDTSELTFRWEPLVSKKFAVGGGALTPYASVPVGIRTRSSNTRDTNGTDLSTQLVLGSQLQVERWKNIQFLGEVGMELGNSLAHVSIAAVWYFDDQNGFQAK